MWVRPPVFYFMIHFDYICAWFAGSVMVYGDSTGYDNRMADFADTCLSAFL